MISKEFLKSKKPTIVKHRIDEWNDDVFVKSMSGFDRDKIIVKKQRNENISVMEVVAYCMCDESGKRLIQDNELDTLADIDLAIMDRIANWGLAASGLSQAASEEIKKN